MAESENTPIGEYTKSKLVKELQECNIINTRLETEYKKREFDGQKNNLKYVQKRISFSTKELENIIEKDKSVLEEVAVQYRHLHELNGCDMKLCSNPHCHTSKTARSESPACDCKKVEEVKDALLKLLQYNYDIYGKLKENIKVFRVTAKYYPDRAVISSGREVVTPETINDLVNDICEQLDQLLKNCKMLWNDADQSSSQLRDSGLGTTCSLDSLAISSSASSDGNWFERERTSRDRSATENTDDQTDVKSCE